jgi:single-strand DNA-binding protein
MINKVTLIGNLGKEPEVRTLENGSKVATFSLATNENYKDRDGNWQTITEWHNIVAWRALADRAERDLKKGSMVYIDGKLTSRKYKDKEGNDRYTTEVVANVLQSLEKRENSGGGSSIPAPSFDDMPGINTGGGSKPAIPSASEEDLPF